MFHSMFGVRQRRRKKKFTFWKILRDFFIQDLTEKTFIFSHTQHWHFKFRSHTHTHRIYEFIWLVTFVFDLSVFWLPKTKDFLFFSQKDFQFFSLCASLNLINQCLSMAKWGFYCCFWWIRFCRMMSMMFDLIRIR